MKTKLSWAMIQRKLQVGTAVTLVEFNTKLPKPHKWLNVPRKIERKQTSGIQFEGGSWLYFDQKDVKKEALSENTFRHRWTVKVNGQEWEESLVYRIEE